MPECRECKDEVTKLVSVKVGGKAVKVCADCADRMREEGEIAEAGEGVIQGMMGYKGRR
jgi:ribosome-binding protein aMBF1 (putative translation factor)